MSTEEIHRHALQMPDNERAALAAELLSSLPVTLTDPDDGIAEGMRRAREMESNPDVGVSWGEIKESLGR